MGPKHQNNEKRSLEGSAVLLNWISVILFVGITAIYPLFLSAGKYASMTQDKKDLFCNFTLIITVLILIILTCLLITKKRFYAKNYFISGEPIRLLSVSEWAIIGFVLLTFISTLLSPYNNNGEIWGGFRYEGFIPLFCYVLTFFIIARFYNPKRLHMLLFAGGSIFVSLIGILQFLGYDIFRLFPFELFPDENGNFMYGPISAYFRTTLGNVNILGAYCSLAIVLFATLYAVAKCKYRFIYLAASMFSFALILIGGMQGSGTDGGKFGILAAMILFIPYWLSDRQKLGRMFVVLSCWSGVYIGFNLYILLLKNQLDELKSIPLYDYYTLLYFKERDLMLVGVAGIILLGIGLLLLYLIKKWQEKTTKIAGIALIIIVFTAGLLFVEVMGARIEEQSGNIVWQAREIMHGRMEDEFGSGRGWIWKNGISVIPQNPFFGTGPDTFIYALGYELQNEAVSRFNVQFDKAHNVLIQIAVCQGIPALLSYLVFIGGLFIPAAKKAFKRPILLAFSCGAFSYFTQSLFCVEVAIVSPLFWVALGVISGEIWRDKIAYDESTF